MRDGIFHDIRGPDRDLSKLFALGCSWQERRLTSRAADIQPCVEVHYCYEPRSPVPSLPFVSAPFRSRTL